MCGGPALKRRAGGGAWSALVLATQRRIDAGQEHGILVGVKAHSDTQECAMQHQSTQ